MIFVSSFGAVSEAYAQGFGGGGFGGGGFSSASVSLVRSGVTPPPEGIIVEEFYNYHFHDIPSPRKGQAIQLDARWGTDRTNSRQRRAYLQIGMATTRDIDLQSARPLNIAFVIDRSGSMANDRIENVKKSLLVAIKKLRPVDRVSVVCFDSQAEVVVESQRFKNPEAIKSGINGIYAQSSTNLCAGLLLGYQQVEKHYHSALNNRVILLTDGKTNQGIKDPEEIARKSVEYNKKGIDLSIIGLGHDFNHSLMRRLARSGRGLIHFVADEKDIEKVFVEELDGLLSAAAKNISLSIKIDDKLHVGHVYGYSPRIGKNSLKFSIDPLNSGTTQIVLAKFQVREQLRNDAKIPISVRLEYTNIVTGKTEKVDKKLTMTFAAEDRQPIDPLEDPSVRRNVTIADIAQGIKGMAKNVRENRMKAARQYLKQRLKLASRRFPRTQDKEVERTRKIAEKYLKRISN